VQDSPWWFAGLVLSCCFSRQRSRYADLGISLPGTFEDPVAPVYIDGKLATTLRGDAIVAEFKEILDKYVESHYGHGAKNEELVGVR